jgi:hypothetical protein
VVLLLGTLVQQGGEALAAPAAAPAVVPSPLADRFSLRGIYYRPSIDTQARFDSDSGVPGTPFDAEDDFGLADQANQGRMELSFRIRGEHRVRADYLKLDRYGEAVLTRTINLRNQVLNPGDFVESSFDLRELGLTYTWLPLRRENFELGAAAGLHFVEVSARAVVRARGIREDGSGVGVLPTLGIDGIWRFAPRWSVSGRLQYLSVNSGDIDGSFGDHHLDVQYRWRPNIAIGLGYSVFRLDVDVEDDDLPGSLAVDAQGPELFFRVSF